MTRPRLPDPWYFTIPELAHEWGCHPDRVAYYLDAGMMFPSALVSKAMLPFEVPGPAPHICVNLSDYRSMRWERTSTGVLAPLAGEFCAFAVDQDAFSVFSVSDLDHVFVERSNLVVTIDQKEELENRQTPPRPVRPNERRTFLAMIGELVSLHYGADASKPYLVAERLRENLQRRGHALSKQAIAEKVREATTALANQPAEAS